MALVRDEEVPAQLYRKGCEVLPDEPPVLFTDRATVFCGGSGEHRIADDRLLVLFEKTNCYVGAILDAEEFSNLVVEDVLVLDQRIHCRSPRV